MSVQLEVENLHAFYGTSHVLFDIRLTVLPGECVCLLGRNGVGKTTTLKTIMGLLPARNGRIIYNGRNLTGLLPHEIARSGIGYAPDERLIFPDLTVRDNLEIAIKPPLTSGTAPWTLERIYNLFPILTRIFHHASKNTAENVVVGR